MQVVSCNAPVGTIEPAPLTSLPIHMGADCFTVSAFWSSDDQYLMRADGPNGATWFRIETEAAAPVSDDVTRLAFGAMMADILPLGAGRVAFPVGSSGRRVYRVWRASKGASGAGQTKILAVRAGRSRRLPA